MRCRVLVLAVLGAALAAAPAAAHPLGNFSVNHLDVVRVSTGRVDVRYVLDQAEIPTFRERGLRPAQVLARTRATVARGVTVTAGGRPLPLRLRPGGRIGFPLGQGGLRTTRVELLLSARVTARGPVVVRDATFPGRVGWHAIVVRPGRGTAVRSSVPAADPTRDLRAYPRSALSAPADRTLARLDVRAGSGTVEAPGQSCRPATRLACGPATRSAGDGFASTLADAAAGRGALVFLVLAAFGWGALHALSPGHGKAMVAAYLVGTRGTARHAVALGIAVTVTHTIGVFALGVVTLALSAAVLPEDLYPWLNLAAGVLVLVVGGGVLRARLRVARTHHDEHDHHHGHDHHRDDAIGRRGLIAMGASAGLLPCPSALVVLLGAIAQHEIALGLLLIVAFSAGLATTLTAVGIAVVHAGRLVTRLRPASRLLEVLPAASAVVIVAAGVLLTARALPGVLA
jgi:ABC-type nickel/cobalt efflux system permease component RcnA